MRRWSFRLERVQRIRAIERDAARGAWAGAQQAEAAVARRLEDVRAAAAAEAAATLGSVRDASGVRAAAFRAQLRAQSAVLAGADLAAAGEVTRAAAAQLQQADRAVRALDRLEARKREVWQVEAARAESAAADEVAGTRAARAALAARRAVPAQAVRP